MRAGDPSTIFAAALIAASVLLSPGAASGAVFYDFSGTCETDCSRFGVPEGTAFSFSRALGFAEGTDTSAGSRAVAVAHFEIFGIDFTPTSAPFATFSAGGAIDALLAGPSAAGNLFCFGVRGLTCDDGRFDTVVAGSSFASGRDGHGPAAFRLHVSAATVPEPVTPALLGIGLVLFGFRQRTPLAA